VRISGLSVCVLNCARISGFCSVYSLVPSQTTVWLLIRSGVLVMVHLFFILFMYDVTYLFA
jgi:hypothetical protein